MTPEFDFNTPATAATFFSNTPGAGPFTSASVNPRQMLDDAMAAMADFRRQHPNYDDTRLLLMLRSTHTRLNEYVKRQNSGVMGYPGENFNVSRLNGFDIEVFDTKLEMMSRAFHLDGIGVKFKVVVEEAEEVVGGTEEAGDGAVDSQSIT
jgi:hypothetical protein